MSNLSNRIQYVPIVGVKGIRKEVTQTLDYLSAPYIQTIKNVKNFVLHPVSDADAGRPDLIAKKYYGSPELWWIICFYNGIINPISELKSGVTLKIPDYSPIAADVRRTNTRTGQVVRL